MTGILSTTQGNTRSFLLSTRILKSKITNGFDQAEESIIEIFEQI
ncbi:hypothetical protein LEP1GSC041_0028 [Leptospira noguchii str. 2006001870]|uniref:Uncharacterized protein n=1 Tax=Leptospira noguchii serovar Autumnalis str. ZUN142 TaxID=1085540 RepID=M6UT47_9LEPT|nr:hypothetical protein LEP1GSC041_0028 [Leptospira noguchii str. 2006001870]EMO40438.1 hypothetical protein LEP1GSC186_4775 [Leptospira noguchii serovar Autumnalis str. ZUN142]